MPGLLAYQAISSGRGNRAGDAKGITMSKFVRVREEANPILPLMQTRAAGRAFANPPLRYPAQIQPSGHGMNAEDGKDPRFLEILKARLLRDETKAERNHYFSSGSEHEPSSLAAMVNDFMEDDAEVSKSISVPRKRDTSSKSSFGDMETEDHCSSLGGELLEILQGFAACDDDAERRVLADVVNMFNFVNTRADQVCKNAGADCTSGCLKRATLKHLRGLGYNAAICKSRWDHAGGLPGGDYEYMDILLDVTDGNANRLIVDVDFRGQFEVARPTDQYAAILQEVPQIFVGKEDRLQQIVNVMSDAVRRSLKERGMHLPPWRKPEYMRAKWFAPYKRTTNDAAHPHKEAELVQPAMRGPGLDPRFTNELELQYMQSEARIAASKDHPQGIENCLYQLDQDNNNHLVAPAPRLVGRMRTGRDKITALTTDWEPPQVEPKNRSRSAKVQGLAAVLIEAGLSTLAKQHKVVSDDKVQFSPFRFGGRPKKVSALAVSLAFDAPAVA